METNRATTKFSLKSRIAFLKYVLATKLAKLKKVDVLKRINSIFQIYLIVYMIAIIAADFITGHASAVTAWKGIALMWMLLYILTNRSYDSLKKLLDETLDITKGAFETNNALIGLIIELKNRFNLPIEIKTQFDKDHKRVVN